MLGKRIAAAVLPGVVDQNINARSISAVSGKLAFLFSRQGSQSTGPLRDLQAYFPPRAELLAAGSAELSVISTTNAYYFATRKPKQRVLTTKQT